MVWEGEGKEYFVIDINPLGTERVLLPLINLDTINMPEGLEITYGRFFEPLPGNDKKEKLDELLESILFNKFYEIGLYSLNKRFKNEGRLYVEKPPTIVSSGLVYSIKLRIKEINKENYENKTKKIMEFDNYLRRVIFPVLKEYIHPLYIPDVNSEKYEIEFKKGLRKVLEQIKRDYKL
jgi:hypothetical protein